MEQLKTDGLAYFDCFAGLVPVKVTSIRAPLTQPAFDLVHGPARLSTQVTAKVTEDCGPYRKGENITSSAIWVVPRGAIRQTRFSRVIQSYDVVLDTQPEPLELEAA